MAISRASLQSVLDLFEKHSPLFSPGFRGFPAAKHLSSPRLLSIVYRLSISGLKTDSRPEIKIADRPGAYFGGFAGDGDGFAGEGIRRGGMNGGFMGGAPLGPAGVGEGAGFFSAMSEARSLSICSIVGFAIR